MSNSKFKKKTKTKDNYIKLDLTKLELSDHLRSAINTYKLIPGKSTTADWLALLSNDWLISLGNDIEKFLKNDDNDLGVKPYDLVNLMFHLLIMETSRHVAKIKVPTAELPKRLQQLLYLCHFEKLSRDGLITNVTASRKISDSECSYSYDLTLNGIIEARKQGANPILTSKLNTKDSDLGSFSETSQAILMRLVLSYVNFLEKREWNKIKTMLDWINQKHDPLGLQAINLVNGYVAQELKLDYESLTQAQRVSFLLDCPQHVKKFFSPEMVSSLAKLIANIESLPQNPEDLYSQENTQLVTNYTAAIEESHKKHSALQTEEQSKQPLIDENSDIVYLEQVSLSSGKSFKEAAFEILTREK